MLKLSIAFLAIFSALYGIEGTYTGSGVDPYGKDTYKVTATFTKDKNGVYQAVWEEVHNKEKASYRGTGLKQGKFFSFVFQNIEDDSDTGLQIYKIKGDTIEGRFVAMGNNLIGEEKLSRVKK